MARNHSGGRAFCKRLRHIIMAITMVARERNEERALEASSRGHHVHMSKKEVRMCVGVMPFVAHETWSLPPSGKP